MPETGKVKRLPPQKKIGSRRLSFFRFRIFLLYWIFSWSGFMESLSLLSLIRKKWAKWLITYISWVSLFMADDNPLRTISLRNNWNCFRSPSEKSSIKRDGFPQLISRVSSSCNIYQIRCYCSNSSLRNKNKNKTKIFFDKFYISLRYILLRNKVFILNLLICHYLPLSINSNSGDNSNNSTITNTSTSPSLQTNNKKQTKKQPTTLHLHHHHHQNGPRLPLPKRKAPQPLPQKQEGPRRVLDIR